MKPSKHMPLLSIVIPVAVGRSNYESLIELISQIQDNQIEIVVVLDKYISTDSKSFEILKSNRFIILTEGRFGSPGAARNYGISFATGKWIAFWDADDKPLVSNFIKMVKTADAKNAVFCGGSFIWHLNKKGPVKFKYLTEGNSSYSCYTISSSPGLWRFAFIRKNITSFSNEQIGEDHRFILQNMNLSKIHYFSRNFVYEYFTDQESEHQSLNKSNLSYLFKILEANLNEVFNSQLHTYFFVAQLQTLFYRSRLPIKLRTGKLLIKFFFKLDYKLKSSLLKTFKDFIKFKFFRFGRYKVIVPITGGLGNQLFQISASLSIAKGELIGIETRIGKPRFNSNNLPELATLNLPDNVEFLDSNKPTKLLAKSSGYLLRIGVNPRFFERNNLFKEMSRYAWNSICILNFRCRLRAINGFGNGYFAMPQLGRRVNLIYGYFQSYFWPDQVVEDLLQIEYFDRNLKYEKFVDLAFRDQPVIVHIRLGDYRNEKTFGLLPKKYYKDCLEFVFNNTNLRNIWLFSDEPNEAINLIPEKYIDRVKIISNHYSAAFTLEIMRLGKGYIIGNSTFSWWAAYLKHEKSAIVCAPEPWFQQNGSPNRILPFNWKAIESFTEVTN